MCIVIAIIFFDFRVAVAIHLLRSHIAVSGTSAMWEDEKSNSHIKMPSDVPDEGFFFTPTPPPESALSVQEANFIREYVGSGSCPFVGRGSLFFTGGGFFFSSL